MSKKINTLKQVQELRENGYVAPGPKPLSKEPVNNKASGLTKSVSAVLTLINFTLTFSILLIMLDYKNERNNITTKLTYIQEALNTNSAQLQSFSGDAEQLKQDLAVVNFNLKESGVKVSQVEKILNAQASSIEELNRASNNLSHNLNLLEREVNKLSGGK